MRRTPLSVTVSSPLAPAKSSSPRTRYPRPPPTGGGSPSGSPHKLVPSKLKLERAGTSLLKRPKYPSAWGAVALLIAACVYVALQRAARRPYREAQTTAERLRSVPCGLARHFSGSSLPWLPEAAAKACQHLSPPVDAARDDTPPRRGRSSRRRPPRCIPTLWRT